MASYSSGSSDEDLDDYTTTNTLLGYASKEPPDDAFNQLGGQPTWPEPENRPSAALAKCKVCNRMMTLLLQLNGDLPERFPGHERRLYVFACRSKTCKKKAGSIRAFRGSKVSRSIPTEERRPGGSPPRKATAPMLGDSIFGTTTSLNSNANPFATPTTTTTTAASNPNPFSTTTAAAANTLQDLASKPPQPPSSTDLPTTFAQKARISSPAPSSPPPPPEPWPPESALLPPYPSYYLEADYETLDKSPSQAPPPSSKTPNNIDEEPSSSSGGGGGKEDATAYESSLDKAFQKFASRLSHNPLQVLRYEMCGSPLLYSTSDSVGKVFSGSTPRVPRCEGCAAGRVFELQLVPQAIAELEVEEVGLEGMEWGTVVLAVCERDCAGQGWCWREEWVGVQWEESAGGGAAGGRAKR